MKQEKMKKVLILAISFLIVNSNLLIAQNDSTEFKKFKAFLPFVMKAIKNSNNELTDKEDMIQKSAYLPVWKINQISQKETDEILNTLETKSQFSIIKGNKSYSELNIISNLQDFNSNPQFNQKLSNLIIEISNFNITNESSQNLYIDSIQNVFQPKINGRQNISLQGAQFNALIPINTTETSLNGEVTLTIREKQDFDHQTLTANEVGETFTLRNTNFECLSIRGNRAMFKINQKIVGLEYVTLNKDGKKHIHCTSSYIPANIYYKSLEEGLTEEGINSYTKDYSYEEFINEQQPYILAYESSGEISEIHLFIANEKKEIGSCKLKISL